MLSGTSRSSARARSWNTVSIPASRASSGPANSTGLPSKMISPRVLLLDRGDLAHEGRLARPVVAHDGHVFAVAEVKSASSSACTPP
jgi:hypothetical protein